MAYLLLISLAMVIKIKEVFKINLNDSMLYFSLYVQLRRGSVAGYTTDES